MEAYLQAKLGRKKMDIMWDHSGMNAHKFRVLNIARSDKTQKLELSWDGNQAKVSQKGTAIVNIPPEGEFSVIDLIMNQRENEAINVVFSDPLDASQETEGLIWLSPEKEITVSINSNIVSIFPSSRPEGPVEHQYRKVD